MFRFFESLVDPYAPYAEIRHAAGPAVAVPRDYLRPARAGHGLDRRSSIFAVAVVEIWLIWYAGRLVDVLGDTPPAEVWARHGLELGAGRALHPVRPAADPDAERARCSTSR